MEKTLIILKPDALQRGGTGFSAPGSAPGLRERVSPERADELAP